MFNKYLNKCILLDRNETMVKNLNEELPYESTGAHKNKPNVEDIFEKENTGNFVVL